MTLRLARALGGVALAATTLVPAGAAVAADQPPNALEGRCEVGRTQLVDDVRALANLRDTGFIDAWREATGRGVTVAVVDSGVDSSNAHLRGAVRKGRSFVGTPVDQDSPGHGTAVAGIIASREVRGSVLVGAAPRAQILPVQVFARESTTSDLAAGIRWAAEQGADVINLSTSTSSSDPNLPALKSAVAFAVRKGAVLVSAAGNSLQGDPYTQTQYPAGLPGVVGVAATNPAGVVDDWSIHGPHVDVAAPGSNTLTAFRSSGDCLVGLDHPYTSYAAAYVSGLAALLKERFPDDSPEQLVNRMLATADRPVADKRDDVRGWGTIQPVAALTSSSNAAPGTAQAASAPGSTRILPAVDQPDPMAPVRRQLAWWLLGAVGLTAVALVLTPWVRRRRSA